MTQPAPVASLVSYPATAGHDETTASGVSWPAVIAGAFGTAALSLILLALGAGLGLSSVSPWADVGASATTIKASAIIWLIVMEILSASMGGYLAGRLRTKWARVHTDEVYFRDTAHGFLAWATALVITAAFLASAATTMAGAAASPKTESSAQSAPGSYAHAYFVDMLFRNGAAKTDDATPEERAETVVIFTNGLRQGALSSNDQSYLDQLVAARTGASQGEADRRVSGVFEAAQQAADATRKAVAHSLLWMFLALLIGAFCASFSATIGGRQRDHVVTI